MIGFISLYRKIWENEFWDDKPFAKGQAWIDLLLMANWEDKNTLINKEIILVKRGDCITSIKKLSIRWGWSRHKVSDYLNIIELKNMIGQVRSSTNILITICKYDSYQDKESLISELSDTKKTGRKKDMKRTQKGHEKDIDETFVNNSESTTNEELEKTKGHEKDLERTGKGYETDTTNKIISKEVNNKEVEEEIHARKKINYLKVWNDFATENKLPTIRSITTERKKHITAREKEEVFDFMLIIEKCANSDFLKKSENKSWFGFDWIINESNYNKILEGKYDNRGNEQKREFVC